MRRTKALVKTKNNGLLSISGSSEIVSVVILPSHALASHSSVTRTSGHALRKLRSDFRSPRRRFSHAVYEPRANRALRSLSQWSLFLCQRRRWLPAGHLSRSSADPAFRCRRSLSALFLRLLGLTVASHSHFTRRINVTAATRCLAPNLSPRG